MTWTEYHPVEDMHAFLDYLETTYPDLVSTESIGSSGEGRDMRIAKVSPMEKLNFKLLKEALVLDCLLNYLNVGFPHIFIWKRGSQCRYYIAVLVLPFGILGFLERENQVHYFKKFEHVLSVRDLNA
jgi:hypothetical protein